MGEIINITNKNVYIKEEAVYYKISKELFTFKPKIGMRLKVLKKSDNTILKIILIKENKKIKRKDISSRFLRFTRIYTLIFSLVLLTLISEEIHVGKEYYPMIFLTSVLLIILSIINAFKKTLGSQSFYFLLTTILYGFMFVVGVVLMFKGSIKSSVILIAVSLVPLIFNTLTLIFKKEMEKTISKPFNKNNKTKF